MRLDVNEEKFNLHLNNDGTVKVSAKREYYSAKVISRLSEEIKSDAIPYEFLELVRKQLSEIPMIVCTNPMPQLTSSKNGSIIVAADRRCATKQDIYAFCAEVDANWAKVIEVTKKVFYDTDDNNHSWTFKLSF